MAVNPNRKIRTAGYPGKAIDMSRTFVLNSFGNHAEKLLANQDVKAGAERASVRVGGSKTDELRTELSVYLKRRYGSKPGFNRPSAAPRNFPRDPDGNSLWGELHKMSQVSH